MTSPHPVGHTLGVSAVLVGLGSFLLGRAVDNDFLSGLFTGIAVGLMIIGVLVISSAWRTKGGWLPSREDDTDWLPSRDEEHR
jgi:hypothetical protein